MSGPPNRSFQSTSRTHEDEFRSNFYPPPYNPYPPQGETVYNNPYNSPSALVEQWNPYGPNPYPSSFPVGPPPPGPSYMPPGPYQLSPLGFSRQLPPPQSGGSNPLPRPEVPSPMEISPVPKPRQQRNGARKTAVSAVTHGLRKVMISRNAYKKKRDNIRNMYCQRKTRKRKDARVASLSIRDEILKQIYARMVVEKAGKEEEDRATLNGDVDRVATMEYQILKLKQKAATYENLMMELMENVRQEKERLSKEEAEITKEAADDAKQALENLRNSHMVVDNNGNEVESDENENIANDESEEDGDA